MAKPSKLDRILRVRTLQLGLVQAEEARAHDRAASEQMLRSRIAQLTANVSPTPAAEPVAGFSLVAAAHFRERLHQSAEAAEGRLRAAQLGAIGLVLVVQVNGKLRDRIEVAPGIDDDALLEMALALPKVEAALGGAEILRKIVVPGKLVNLVVGGK